VKNFFQRVDNEIPDSCQDAIEMKNEYKKPGNMYHCVHSGDEDPPFQIVCFVHVVHLGTCTCESYNFLFLGTNYPRGKLSRDESSPGTNYPWGELIIHVQIILRGKLSGDELSWNHPNFGGWAV
jgi:hypothetical protein